MIPHGKAIIFSAPSGAGKTTIVQHLATSLPELAFSVSATTRNPRPTEVDGRDYYFLSDEAFDQALQRNEFIEWEEVYQGLRYGTRKSELERIWQLNKHILFDVDVQGGLNIKRNLKERALAVFVRVADIEVLRNRLVKRQTESSAQIEQRVQKAWAENEYADQFDAVIVNDRLDDALKQAEKLVKDFLKK